jgi:hypothetical protein
MQSTNMPMLAISFYKMYKCDQGVDMLHEVDNRVPFGVTNDGFESVGAGSAERYAESDGLIAGVAKAAKLVIMARERNATADQYERAMTLFRSRVSQLFGEYDQDASAIANATMFKVGGVKVSYNSLHISVPNPDYVAPKAHTSTNPDGSVVTSWDWSEARGTQYIDVTAEEVMADPALALELVVHNDFHL